jgi:hypothetical protein
VSAPRFFHAWGGLVAIAKGDKGKHKLVAQFGVGFGTVARIKAEMEAANACARVMSDLSFWRSAFHPVPK